VSSPPETDILLFTDENYRPTKAENIWKMYIELNGKRKRETLS